MYGTERRNIRNIYIPYIRGGGGGFLGNAETMLAVPLDTGMLVRMISLKECIHYVRSRGWLGI